MDSDLLLGKPEHSSDADLATNDDAPELLATGTTRGFVRLAAGQGVLRRSSTGSRHGSVRGLTGLHSTVPLAASGEQNMTYW